MEDGRGRAGKGGSRTCRWGLERVHHQKPSSELERARAARGGVQRCSSAVIIVVAAAPTPCYAHPPLLPPLLPQRRDGVDLAAPSPVVPKSHTIRAAAVPQAPPPPRQRGLLTSSSLWQRGLFAPHSSAYLRWRRGWVEETASRGGVRAHLVGGRQGWRRWQLGTWDGRDEEMREKPQGCAWRRGQQQNAVEDAEPAGSSKVVIPSSFWRCSRGCRSFFF